jgi:hypothetical protein
MVCEHGKFGFRKGTVVLIAIMAFLNACRQRAPETAARLSPIPSVLEQLFVHSDFQPWFQAWRLVLPDLSPHSFSARDTTQITFPKWARPLKELERRRPPWEIRRRLLVFSPDERWAIDYLSSRIFPHGEKWRYGKVPDSEVDLYDFVNEVYYQVLFSGPSGGYDIAAWPDSTTFAVGGWTLSAEEPLGQHPVIFVVSVQNGRCIRYLGPRVETDHRGSPVWERLVQEREKRFPFVEWRQ